MTEAALADELRALAVLPTKDLVARHVALFGSPPRCRQRGPLLRRIAWRLQEQRLGGLSGTARARLAALQAEIDLGAAPGPSRRHRGQVRRDGAPAVGTVLSRTWRDREIEVWVREDGFEFEGVLYRSLSAVARAITGTRWNGRVFFGLSKRKRAKTRR